MIFYRFLLNTQALGYLFVLEMLLAAHAINHLALLRHAFYHHVDEQLGILCHHIVMWRRFVGVSVWQTVNIYWDDVLGGNIVDDSIFCQNKEVGIEVLDIGKLLAFVSYL